MKYHPLFKGLAIFLAAVTLVLCILSAICIYGLASNDLYTDDLHTWIYVHQEELAYDIGYHTLRRYVSANFGNCPQELLEYLGYAFTDESIGRLCGLEQDQWYYQIQDQDGSHLEGVSDVSGMLCYTFLMNANYPVLLKTEALNTDPVDATIPTNTDMADATIFATTYTVEATLPPTTDMGVYYDYDLIIINDTEYYINYSTSETYTVTVWLLEDTLGYYRIDTVQLLELLYPHRFTFILCAAAGLLAFLGCLVYLYFAAGRCQDRCAVRAGGLNRIPLDLYFLLGGSLCCGAVAIGYALLEYGVDFNAGVYSVSYALVILAGAAILAGAVIGVCFLFALFAQVKMPGRFWWKNSITGRLLGWTWKGIRFCFKGLGKFFRLLPLIWQWLLAGVVMGFIPLFFFFLTAVGRSFWLLPFFASLIWDLGIVCYGAYAFGLLSKGAKQMSAGDLDSKISTQHLFGCFRDFAHHLNALSDAATVAAKKQLQSERMKTELITNVSHDIKTPLTSIVNYVDLLEKPHTEAEGEQYLEVLSRQSLRLKKLLEDLMDMSKASTGNMAVDITRVDAVEALNQALGEFSDKLDGAALCVIFRHPEEAYIQADGRITWRVLSNLLSNIVKYALPGTRVYIDLVQGEHQVQVSLKNISKEPLNVSAQELTERFVRGDASRNTEGSGLGLNIAQSLMELQKGRLDLLVDGDLFKVTLTFPTQ